MLGQFRQLLSQDLKLLLALFARDRLNLLEAKGLVDRDGARLRGSPMLVVVCCAAQDDCWVDLLTWEVLLRQLLQLSCV